MAGESWKSQTWWNLPVYTGDVSGVCSALYELGGMVVMHDPSGCNSTYNTHDEIRWVSMESLIFLSGLTQLDAITGNDQRLIDDIVSAANTFHPAFIAIANSPVPWLIGTDFEAICKKVTALTGIASFHVETNAMHDYTKGAGQAFLHLAKMLLSEDAGAADDSGTLRGFPGTDRIIAADTNPDGRRIRLNILGMTPLDYPVREDAMAMRRILEEEGFAVVSNWAIGDGLQSLKRSAGADVNLVVSSTGMETARWMEETFGIPYTVGVPTGSFRRILCEAVKKSALTRKSSVPYLEILNSLPSREKRKNPDTPVRCIAGEPVTMGSAAADIVLTDGKPCDLIALTETRQGLLPEQGFTPEGERQIREVLAEYEEVTADPMLKEACRSGCRFHALPHFALSGRLYLNQIGSLLEKGGSL